MLNKLMIKSKETMNQYVNNEEGAQALEWVALGLVVLAVMAAVATAVNGNGDGIASAIVDRIAQMISDI